MAGAKIAGLPRVPVIVAAVTLAAALAWIAWKRHTASSSAPAAAAATGCTDSSGNPVPCPDSSAVDYAGQLSVIQTELETLQQGQAADLASDKPAAGGTTTSTATGKTTMAPPGFSVTGHKGFADFGWGPVPNARGYNLVVTGKGGKGTGTGHYDSIVNGTHARVNLTPGAYQARVRGAGDASNPFTAWRGFTVAK